MRGNPGTVFLMVCCLMFIAGYGLSAQSPSNTANGAGLDRYMVIVKNNLFSPLGSGGEIKKSELLQLMAQDPNLLLLDEPESGVDLENIALVGEVIAELLDKSIKHFEEPMIEHKKKRKKSGIIITHTGFIMRYVHADAGHVILNGRLSGASNPEEIFACVSKFGYEECVRCMV